MKQITIYKFMVGLLLFLTAQTTIAVPPPPPSPTNYCLPTYTNASCAIGSQDYIESFETSNGIQNISNLNTGCTHPDNDPNYYYYSGLNNTASEIQGNWISFTITNTPSFAENVKIWVDWNQDGVFTDSTELMYHANAALGANIPAGGIVTDSMQVPFTAIPGITRMRVRLVFNNTTFTDCSSQTYGETEDYDFLVVPIGPCTAPPAIANVVSNIPVACPGAQIALTVSGISYGTGETYQWQESTNGGVSYSNITGATAVTSLVTVNVPTMYRCVVSCSGQSTNSNSTTVTITNLSGLNAVVPDSSVCENSTHTFSVTNTPSGNSLSYQWQESIDGVSYIDIFGETNPTLSYLVLDTVFIRCVVSCGSVTDTSSAVPVTLNPITQCYCITSLGGACGANNITDVEVPTTTLSNLGTGCANVAGTGSYAVYPATGNTTASLIQYGSYNLNVTTSGTSIISVWIDYDQSGTFDPNEWTQIAGGALNPSAAGVPNTITLTIPGNAIPGVTGMRIRSRASGSPNGDVNPCTEFFSGETEDYFITILQAPACTAPPLGGTAVAALDSACIGQPFNVLLTGFSPSSAQTFQWQSSTNGVNWVDLANDTNIVLTTSLTQNTYYRCAVTCSNQTTFSVIDTVLVGNCVLITSGTVTTCGTTFYDSNPLGNYSNNESNVLTILPNAINSVVEVTFNTFNTSFGDILNIYDGANTGGLLIGSFQGTTSPGTVTATNATGGLTFEFISNGFTNNIGWDASVNCVTVIPCSGTPVAGNAVATDSSVCLNSTIDLSVSGNTTDFGITYQWQSSADGVTFTNEAGATNPIYTATIADSVYYRCIISCGTNSSNTSIVHILLNPFYECYCGPSTAVNLGGFCGGNNVEDVVITGTTLSNIGSGCNTTPFGSYSSFPATGSTTATLQQLVTYQLSVNNSGNSIQSLWIDYDHSGSFDANEWTQISTTSTAGNSSVVNFTVPLTSLTGITGLRIRSRANGNPNGDVNACTNFGSGETEDYIITINAAVPCTAPPTAGSISAADTSACPGSVLNFVVTGNSVGYGQTYQWQTSSNGTSGWVDLLNDTLASLAYTVPATGEYIKLNITCGGQTVSTPAQYITAQNCILFTSGVDSVVTTCTGTFYDSGADVANYQDNETGSITFYPGSANSAIQLDFTAFNTENAYDGMQIFDGPSITSPQILSGLAVGNNVTTAPANSYYGLNSPGTITSSDITGAITVVFNSEFTVNRPGWEAAISCVPQVLCTGTPNGGNASASDSTVCSGASLDLSVTGNTTGAGIQYQWEESNDGGISWNPIAGANTINYTTVVTLDSTIYRCLITCAASGLSAPSSQVLVTFNSFYECYCGPATSTNLGGFCGSNDIESVEILGTTLSNLNNGCNNTSLGSYTLYFPTTTNTTATLQQGVPYQLAVTNGGNSIQSVWIDYNGNGNYQNNEWTQVSTTSTPGVPNVITFTIPATSVVGLTGMRIRSRGVGNVNGAASDCANFGSGETEEYIINIVPALPCVAPPTAGIVTSNTTSACGGVNFSMYLTGNSIGLGQTYQWYTSSNGNTFAPIAGATNSAVTTSQGSTSYYYCQVTCSGQTAISDTLMMLTDCYTILTDSINACSGTFFDSNPLGNYGSNEVNISTIYPGSANSAVSVTFNNFATEAGYDFLFVYDGIGTNNLIGTFDGTNNPGTILSTDPSGALTFEFTSDGSGIDIGWDATISCVAPCTGAPVAGTVNSSVTDACAGLTFDLSLNGNTIGTGMTYDWQSASAANGPWTSFATTSTAATSQSVTTYYRCVMTCTNSSLSDTTAAFMMQTTCYTSLADTVYACSGSFYDSNPNGDYDNNEATSTVIYPGSSGNIVSLTFNTFDTETGYDFMEVFNGVGTTTSLGVFDGTTNPGPFISTDPSGALTVVFNSDGITTAAGWDATINCVNVGACTTPVISAATSTAICQGGSVALTANTPLVSWTTNPVNSNNGSTSLSITANASGTYFVTNTSPACVGLPTTITQSNVITVTVNPNPTAVLAVDDNTLCAGQVANFVVTPTNGATYSWSGASSTTNTATSSVASPVSVTVTSNGCSTTSNVINVTVDPIPSAPVITPSGTVLCPSNTITLTSSYATGNTWTGPNGFTSTQASININTIGTYSVSNTNANGCSSAASSITITGASAPTITLAAGSTQFCLGTTPTAVLVSSSASGNLWNDASASTSQSLNVQAAGTYFTTVSVAGCPNPVQSNSITITANVPVAAVITPSTSSLCSNASATLTCNADPSYVTYAWSYNGTGTGCFTAANNVATVTCTGLYEVTVTDNNGCQTTSTTASITTGTAPTPVLTSTPQNATACEPNGVTLTTATGQGGYEWLQNGVLNTSLGTSNSITITQTGNFKVRVTDNGCTGVSNVVAVTIKPLPQASFIAVKDTGCNGIVRFINTSTNSSTYQWNFGDNTQQVNFTNATHTYFTSGNYTVTLVAQNSCGSDTAIVPVNGVCSVIGSILDVNSSDNVAIYPNPTNSKITLTFENVDARLMKVEIVSITGQVLFTETKNQFHGKFQQEIDMNKFAQGVYFVRIVTDGNSITKKVIKE
jgi:hypothetical protein